MEAAAPDLTIVLRQATVDDVRTLQQLIGESARSLGQSDYSSGQIEAPLRSAWAVDRRPASLSRYFRDQVLAEAEVQYVAA